MSPTDSGLTGIRLAELMAALLPATDLAMGQPVDNHIQHIYAKIGVTTRAGATLFAMEQGLVGERADA